jgi:hypothetical protein
MTFTGTTANLKSISIDPVSNGTLFVTDALGAVLQGDISGNSIAFSPVEGISQTYDTVNVVPIHDQSYLLKHNDPTDFTQFSSTLIDANTSGVFEIEGMGMGVVLSNGINTNINIYDYNLNALVTGSAIQIAQSTASASSWTVGANKFVLIAGGTTFYVYNVTNTASVQLVSTQNVSTVITGLQQGQTLQEINNVVCFLSGSSSGFFIGTSNLSTTGYPDLFGSFTYTNTTFSTLSGASVIYTGYQYRTESNNIPVNKSLGEVYLQTHGSGLQNQVTYGVLIYNYSAQDISCTISTVTLNNMFVPEVIDGTFAWQQKTFTPEQAISSLCFSQTNPNKMYVVDSDDNLLYQTNVNLPAPYVSTRVLNTPDEMSSVSSGLPTLTNVNSTAYCYNLQGGQTLIGSFNVQNAPILAIGKDRVSYNGQGEFILSSYHNEVVSLAPSGFASQWVVTPFDTAGFIYVKPGEDLYAGDVSIYDYETLVRNINQAFAEAYGYLVSDGGQGMIGPPVISLDPVTSKLTLTYAAPYSEAGNGILFNNSMLQLCKFSSTPDTIDPGMNLLLLPEASTSLTQISRSIYIFNQLDQILLVSNTIFVIGSLYGNNLQNNILQDFSVPISDQPGNQGVVLYVQPNFVSTLTIGSNQAIQRIQLRVLYKYKDETTYPLLLAPNSNWTAKMMFIKKY